MKKFTFDMGGSGIKYIIFKDNLEFKKGILKYPSQEKFSRVEITDVLNTIKPLIDSENTTSESFEVGMSIPGVLDSINNKFYEPGAVYVGDYDIESFFKKFKGFKKFKFESDGHASTIGEFIYGGHENLKNHVHITIGSAVGMGIIINKKLYRGIKFRAGEISKCYASITSEVNEPVALEVGLGAMSFMYSKITNTELMSGEELFEKYEKNDPKIIELFDKWTTAIAKLCFNLYWILDYEKLTIGGGVSSNKTFQRLVMEKISKYKELKYFDMTISEISNFSEIVSIANLKNDAACYGMLALLNDEFVVSKDF